MNDELAKEAEKRIYQKLMQAEGQAREGNLRRAILEAKEALSLLESLEYYQTRKVA